MGLAGRFARSQARSGKFALGFGFPLESAARRLAASVRLFQPVRHPSRRPARQVSLLFSCRRFTRLKWTSRQWLTKWLTNQVEIGSSDSDTIRLNTQ